MHKFSKKQYVFCRFFIVGLTKYQVSIYSCCTRKGCYHKRENYLDNECLRIIQKQKKAQQPLRVAVPV